MMMMMTRIIWIILAWYCCLLLGEQNHVLIGTNDIRLQYESQVQGNRFDTAIDVIPTYVPTMRPSYYGTFPTSQYNSLYDLYYATNGPDWKWYPSKYGAKWNFSVPSVNPCLALWQGITCNYSATEEVYVVSELQLVNYRMKGAIPASIRNLGNLTRLDLRKNQLRNPLPETFFTFPNLLELRLTTNLFTGRIPIGFGNLSSLQKLYLGSNEFSGPIPAELGNLQNLQRLDLSENNLSISIPKSFSRLKSLQSLNIANNHLTGNLDILRNLTSLLYISIFSNDLFGSITDDTFPSSMLGIDLSNNLLSGTFPVSLNAKNLRVLSLEFNQFYGYFNKTFLTSLPALTGINIAGNDLYGNVTNHFNENPLLQLIQIATNQFTGSLPPVELSIYAVARNYFTGSVPFIFQNGTNFSIVDVSDNYLYGKIQFLNSYPSTINISSNFFTGKLDNLIPQKVITDDNIEDFAFSIDASQNSFTGTFPQYWASALPYAAGIAVCNNELTGTLPNEWHSYGSLEYFGASGNCFHGSIPDGFCSLDSLSVLILNGLSSSPSCRKKLFPNTNLPAFFNRYEIRHGIPHCLFSLPKLQTLQLSGNELTGTLPNNATYSSLIQLDLSHNDLSGTIPEVVQTKPWISLDLSYNYLSGELSRNIFNFSVLPNNSLTLAVNRLSGEIPSRLFQASQINILDGNLFNCDFYQPDLPENDPNKDIYSCGSDIVNSSLFLWLELVGFLLVVVLFIRLLFYLTGGAYSWISYFYSNIKRIEVWYKYFHRYCETEYSRRMLTIDEKDGGRTVSGMEQMEEETPRRIRERRRTLNEDDDDDELEGYEEDDTDQKDEKENEEDEKVDATANRLTTGSNKGPGEERTTEINRARYKRKKPRINSIVLYWLVNRKANKTITILMLFVLFVLFPTYCWLSKHYSTYQDKYAWSVSGLFLNGTESGVLLSVELFLLLVFTIIVFLYIWIFQVEKKEEIEEIENNNNSSEQNDQSENQQQQITWYQWICRPFRCSLFTNYTWKLDRWMFDIKETEKIKNPRHYELFSFFLISLTNFTVMLISDIFYVYIVVNYDPIIVLCSEFFLAVFKMGWNNVVLWQLVLYFHKSVYQSFLRWGWIDKDLPEETEKIDQKAKNKKNGDDEHDDDQWHRYSYLDVAFISMTFGLNNLIYPIIAIMIISTNCFYHVIWPNPMVSYSFTRIYVDGKAQEYSYTLHSSFEPPFSYGYQCSSVIYAYYCPVLILMLLFESVIVPCLQLSLWLGMNHNFEEWKELNHVELVPHVEMMIDDRMNQPSTSVAASTSKHRLTTLLKFLRTFSLPGTAADQRETTATEGHDLSDFLAEKGIRSRRQQKKGDDGDTNDTGGSERDLETNSSGKQQEQEQEQEQPRPTEQSQLSNNASDNSRKFSLDAILRFTKTFQLVTLQSSRQYASNLFNKDHYIVRFNSYVMILLAFGAVFPPVAVSACLAVIFRIFYREITLGRFLYESHRKHLKWYEEELKKNCTGIMTPMRYSLAIIIPISTLLYAYLIFDSLGREQSLLVALVPGMILWALALFVVAMTIYWNRRINAEMRKRLQARRKNPKTKSTTRKLTFNEIVTEKEREGEEKENKPETFNPMATRVDDAL